MNKSFLEFPSKEKLFEAFIQPETADQPLIRVFEEKESEVFKAMFAIELVGVTKNKYTKKDAEGLKEEDVSARDRYRSTLIAGMSIDQSIDCIYTAGKDDKGTVHFNWKVIGSSQGESPEEAVYTAQKLWQSINVIFGFTEKDYQFAPVKDQRKLYDAMPDNYWVGTIKPVGITVNVSNNKPMGFLMDTEVATRESSVIIVPREDEQKIRNFDAVVIGAAGCPAPIRVILSIRPLVLTKDELMKIEAALKWLRSNNRKQIKYHEEIKEGTEDIAAIKKLERNLEQWIKSHSGIRVNCVALSSEPIPSSFLTMVGSDIFQGVPISVNMEKAGSDADSLSIEKNNNKMDTLDLQDCINGMSALPPLFPGVETLIDIGVKRIYSNVSIDISGDGVILGHIGEGEIKREVHFSRADRSRHCYIIGATGTGKSTLLYNMIRQDIENGEGVTLVDPHGDLYQQVLSSIPQKRINDVILVDPCDFKHAVGINFLECNDLYKPVQLNFIVNEMIKIFDRLYDLRATGGPMFEQYMRNALLLTMDNGFPGATLVDIPAIFEDKDYRRFLIERCYSTFVKTFWTKQAERAGGEAALENMGPYITSKLNQFTTNALLRPIIGQPKSTIDFRKAMDRKQILLVNLSKGLLGELDTQLLGMLIIGKIFSAAMGRINQRPEDRKAMFLYVDEFQNFTTDSVAHLLSEARKFGICLTLANQNLSQLSANSGKHNILDSVLGNVGSSLIFRLGPIDSDKMETYVKPEFHALDLQELPDFHVAGRILNKNTPTKPFVFKTMPVSHITNPASIDEIVTNSRKQYTMPTEQVEKEINSRRSMYDHSSDDHN